jgi:hypothetical protein
MNSAQKRTWWTFVISAATLLISALVIWYVWANQIKIIDLQNLMRIRLIGLLNTIPLILIVILEIRIRKNEYDERDKFIARKSSGIGYITTVTFFVVAGYCLFLINPRGSTRNIYWVMRGAYLLYLAIFIGFLASAAAALIQYGKGGNNGNQ